MNALAKAHLSANRHERASEAIFSQSRHIAKSLALLTFYQDHQLEKVTQLIPEISRLVD